MSGDTVFVATCGECGTEVEKDTEDAAEAVVDDHNEGLHADDEDDPAVVTTREKATGPDDDQRVDAEATLRAALAVAVGLENSQEVGTDA